MLVRAVRSRQRGTFDPRHRYCRDCDRGRSVLRRFPARSRRAPLPKTHTVKRGDTLWDIAKTYLGDAFLWPEIYRLNTDIIEDPHWIYPDELLKLPGQQAKVVAVTPPPAAGRRRKPPLRAAAVVRGARAR